MHTHSHSETQAPHSSHTQSRTPRRGQQRGWKTLGPNLYQEGPSHPARASVSPRGPSEVPGGCESPHQTVASLCLLRARLRGAQIWWLSQGIACPWKPGSDKRGQEAACGCCVMWAAGGPPPSSLPPPSPAPLSCPHFLRFYEQTPYMNLFLSGPLLGSLAKGTHLLASTLSGHRSNLTYSSGLF